jgi:hypothetical protein
MMDVATTGPAARDAQMNTVLVTEESSSSQNGKISRTVATLAKKDGIFGFKNLARFARAGFLVPACLG